MRGIFMLMIFLIGMISLTGFSTTIDPAKNSDVVSFVDVDVGIDAALVEQVSFNLITNANFTKEQAIEVPYLILKFSDKQDYFETLHTYTKTDDIDHPPNRHRLVYRRPRDGYEKVWAW